MKTYTFSVEARPLPGDLITPVAAYLRVRDLFPQSALMESSDYHSAETARSFIALDPIASVSVSHGMVTYRLPDDTTETAELSETLTLAQALRNFLSRLSVSGDYAHYCGLYGYTSSNAIRYLEPIDIKDSTDELNDAPDVIYVLYRYLLIFNDYRHELVLAGLHGAGETLNLDRVAQAVLAPSQATYNFKTLGPTTSPLTDEEHLANIRRGIAHCLRGDVFQIVLSRRFEQRFEGDDFEVYRALRSINPSPYLFYFDFGGMRLFGSSPETHCRVEGGRAYIDPIAGTMRREGNAERDAEVARQLLQDPKENAEHTMLVDLARNDLSRDCKDVGVDFFKDVQKYSHVIHLVSRVSGRVAEGADACDLLCNTFPAGTLSGAPKVRALQLISLYEPHNRGAYGGCIGFIGLAGSLNQAITIRTFVSRNGTLWFQAGGGITAQSDPDTELQEVNNKLGALRHAITLAEKRA